MNTFNDIAPTSKITSMTWAEAVVDLITEKWIYTSFRCQNLKSFDRLYFDKARVDEMFRDKTWKLIDWRIKTTLVEIRKLYSWNIFIEWIDKEQSLDEIFEKKQKGVIVSCINVPWLFRKVLWTETIDWVKYIHLTPMLRDFTSPTESAVKLIYMFDEVKDTISLNSSNRTTLNNIAVSMYEVPDATFLNITDLNNGN